LIIIIIYLILRYTPFIKLDIYKAIILTLIFVLLFCFIEFIYNNIIKLCEMKNQIKNEESNIKNEINQDRSYENFQNHDCDCDDKPPEKKKYIKKCRIICDDNEEETIFKNLKIQEFNEEQKQYLDSLQENINE